VTAPELRALLREHLATPWPESVERGSEYGGVDLVLIDADIFGLASREGPASADDRAWLATTADNLEDLLGQLPVDARPYFGRLVEVARVRAGIR
jgi:hypothetical protein